jgi:3-deoxy-D-arabino-heptulosonate 7-phosphate (DAHP) synthase
VTSPFEGIKLAAREGSRRKTVVEVGGAKIGEKLTLIAGLETASDESATLAVAEAARAAGAALLRWPPVEAGDFARAGTLAARIGLPVIAEVADTRDVAAAAAAADVLLVGAANMQNFSLLKELGRSARRPVLLVRGWHATLKEWLNSAEYVLFEGNPSVILCDSGIRGFEAGDRVIYDLSAIPALKGVSHLPVLFDLSRAGEAPEIEKLGLAAVAAGADGLIVEVAPAAFAGLARKFAAMDRLVEGLAVDHD